MTDPSAAKHYELSALFGPCTQEEAEELLDAVAEFVYGRENYDACVALRIDTEFEDERV